MRPRDGHTSGRERVRETSLARAVRSAGTLPDAMAGGLRAFCGMGVCLECEGDDGVRRCLVRDES